MRYFDTIMHKNERSNICSRCALSDHVLDLKVDSKRDLKGCSEQIAMEGQKMHRTCLAHHEPESVVMFTIITILIITS